MTLQGMTPRCDYDAIADAYGRRYSRNDYSGVERALTAFVGTHPDVRVLEVGCGTGHWLRMLVEKGIRAAGLDASIGMLAYARDDARCPVVHGLAEQLPWASASFDRLFCVNALHHFQNKAAFAAEARRVLRPGGQMMTIGLDPHAGVDHWYVYEYFEPAFLTDTRRYLATNEIRDIMQAAGFVDCATHEIQHIPARLPARTALEQGRLDRSATSQLSLLTDEQYGLGIDRIRKEIESAEAVGDTLYLTADLRLYATFGSVDVTPHIEP